MYYDLVSDGLVQTGTGLTTVQAEANRAKIQAAFDLPSRPIITAPRDTVIEHTACLRPNNNVTIAGDWTLRLANNQNATQFSVESPTRYIPRTNVNISNITLDGNAQNQTNAFYVFAAWNFNKLKLERVTFKDFWATAANINDLDTEGTGGSWTNPNNGLVHQIALQPYGEQTSYDLEIIKCKTLRTANNHAHANTYPSMWQGDQFVIGKVGKVDVDGLSVAHSGQNGVALQFIRDGRFRAISVDSCARQIYLETCRDILIETPHLQNHRLINNDAYNLSDTYGIWLADGDQSYPGLNYYSCFNVAIVAPVIHNFSRPYGASGRFRGLCVSGKTSYPATNISILGGLIAEINQNTSNPQKAIGLSLQGKILGLKANPLIRGIDGTAIVTNEYYGSNAPSTTEVSIT